MKLQYNSQYRGARAYAISSGAQYTDHIENYGTVYSAEKGSYVDLTGYYVEYSASDVRMQTTSGLWIVLSGNQAWGDIKYNVTSIPNYSQNQAQVYVDKIIRNNQIIISNNILCARFASKLNATQKGELYDLQKRLQVRNASLIEDGFCEGLTKNYPKGYVYLQNYLDEFMKYGGAGVGIVVSTTVAIIATAVVIGSLATAAYFAYKYMAEESEQDVKFSKELTKSLVEKLTPEEYEQLRQETAGLITKSKIKASLGTYANILKWAVAGAAGYFLFKTLKNKKQL